MKKTAYIILGLICVALGGIGSLIPILPTVPFLLLAAFCFAKSSEKLHAWFIATNLYKNNLESLSQGRGMTMKAKIRVITIVTITMAIGYLFMSNVPIGRICLAIVWIAHVLVFTLGIKTIPEEE